jgi:hypothetical protein
VVRKYLRNPHNDLCPGAGLYAAMDGERISGIMGAYALPIRYNGATYPAHLLCDWVVLPQYHSGLTAGKLFYTAQKLPGLKLGSDGTSVSYSNMSVRFSQVKSVVAVAMLQPFSAAVVKLLNLHLTARPCPAQASNFDLGDYAEIISGEQLPLFRPAEEKDTAYVDRDAFWENYLETRVHHNAFALRLHSGKHTGTMIVTLLQSGRFRLSHLMALQLDTPSREAARALGAAAGRALRTMEVCLLFGTEPDDLTQAFLNAAAVHVIRRPAHWWLMPTPNPPFSMQDAHWWLTSADRDGIWQPGLQVSHA